MIDNEQIAELRAAAGRLKEAKSSYQSWQRPGMSPDYGPSGAARCSQLFLCADEASAAIIALADEVERLRAALEWYANPEIYKPHPHGSAFDNRDLSFAARRALHGDKQESLL